MYLIIWLDRKCFFRPWLRNSNCQSIPSWLRFHAYMIILLLLNLCITKKELTSDNWTCGSMFNNSGQTFLLVSKVWQNSLCFLFESTKFLINSVDFLVLYHTYYYDTLANFTKDWACCCGTCKSVYINKNIFLIFRINFNNQI